MFGFCSIDKNTQDRLLLSWASPLSPLITIILCMCASPQRGLGFRVEGDVYGTCQWQNKVFGGGLL